MEAEPVPDVEAFSRDGVTLTADAIAMLRHDLSSAIGAMTGAADLLHGHWEQFSRAQVSHLLEVLERRGRQARQLLSDMNDLAEFGRNGVGLQVCPVAVRGLVAEAVLSVDRPAEVDLGVCLQPGTWVMADAFRVQQILANLLSNAYRYGGDKVWVDVSQSGDEVVISVADDGDGIPAELLDRLFEPYVRGPDSKRKGGTGLGLSVVRALAVAQSGRIEHVPTPRGCQFRLFLPRAEPGAECDDRAVAVPPEVDQEAAPFDHAVVVGDADRTAAAATGHLARALGRGDAVVMVTTPERGDRIAAELTVQGIDVAAVRAEGRWVDVPVDDLLEQCWTHGWDEAAFCAVVTAAIESLPAGAAGVQVVSEVVDRVPLDERAAAATALRLAWNRLYTRRLFRLLRTHAPVEVSGAGPMAAAAPVDEHRLVSPER